MRITHSNKFQCNKKERKIDMKNYQKPQIDITVILNKENISSGLAEWLQSAEGEAYSDAGITTYVIAS